jgi:plasmid stabilization system protein ParE
VIAYSSEGLADIDRLFTWLEARNPDAAARFLAALRQTAQRITERPLLHPVVDDGALRKCLMRFGGSAYVIYYAIEGENQIIVRVWHGREERR